MMHVWDHFDYTNDVEWWKRQGWPLLKVLHNEHDLRLSSDELRSGSRERPVSIWIDLSRTDISTTLNWLWLHATRPNNNPLPLVNGLVPSRLFVPESNHRRVFTFAAADMGNVQCC